MNTIITSIIQGFVTAIVAAVAVVFVALVYGSLCLGLGLIVGVVTFLVLTFAANVLIPAVTGAAGSSSSSSSSSMLTPGR